MAKPKRMDQIKSILRCYLATRSIKATARTLLVSKNTVRQYLRRAHSSDKELAVLLEMDEASLIQVFSSGLKLEATPRETHFVQRVDHWLEQLQKPGVTRKLLWEEYRRDHPLGYGFSQFCLRLQRHIQSRDLTLAMEHTPGEVMMLDFAGKKMHWTDPKTQTVHYAQVLVAVMPYSHFCFCIALPSQQISDFVHGVNRAVLYMQGLPNKILSDNLKAYVVKSDRYEPRFTQLCEQMADYYGIQLTATRVAKPKDKASVENAVTQVYRSIYAPLRHETFDSLEDLNGAILEQLEALNSKPFQKRSGSRRSIFEQFESPCLKTLPPELFEIKRQTAAKVQRNYHVFLGEDKHYYSVPYDLTGQQAQLIYTRSHVEVYIRQRRVAVHKRLSSQIGPYKYQTQADHMPRHHQEWKEAQGYNAAYFIQRADRVGKATRWAIEQVLISRIQEAQSYNSCKGILRLADHYGAERLESACMRCQPLGQVSYTVLSNILSHNLDQAEELPESWNMGTHDNIRGADYYQ